MKRLIVMSDRPSPETAGLAFVGDYESLLAAASPDFAFPDFDENTQATTFYTTGTTGLPKGVYYSHRQLVLHALAELAFLGIAGKQGRFSRDDVYMPITPMFHVHAWGFPWAATLAGVKQVYPGRYDPALLVKLIKSEGVTFTHGVPTILQMVLNAAAAAKTDLAGLKMVIGGSALTKALAKQALAAGIDIFAGYGMSETGPLSAIAQVRTPTSTAIRISRSMSAPRRIDRAAGRSAHRRSWHDGRPARRQNLRRDCPSRALADAGLFQQSFRIGRSVGGRLSAYVRRRGHSPDGYVRITDRIKDVIKTGGEWVSSLQIEDLIAHCPGVAEAAVIGVKDEKWGERPLALVVRDRSRGAELIDDHKIRGASQGLLGRRRHFEIRDSGEDPVHRGHPENERGQDRQEGPSRKVR